ncbi:MAG: 30S ribosomal protein S17 [Alphaproteobacteria bacterium CG_4_9_14_3_um_filter_47_13]|nr:MAG: 30S ribosomal protein S17 [Alphaproteobacteria bacterium CG_4_9_14_3_um_filter_47_13]
MPKRILEGDVVSDKMDKTVTVLVERRYRHPVYKKYVKRTDKYAAHDETNSFVVGDRVQIEECKPLSKRKSWVVITTPAPGTARIRVQTQKAVTEKKMPIKKEAAKKADVKEKAPKAEAKKAVAKKTVKKETSKKKDESR